jgi:hypothetical protein
MKAVAMTAGLIWAGCILLIGIVHLADPRYGSGFLTVMSSLYPGLHFAHAWENILGGTVYGFVDGVIAGLLFAWVYDHLVSWTRARNHHA